MSTRKRILISMALALVVMASTASTSDAQVFRGRRVVVAAPVFVGGYYSPYWLYDPWFGYGYQGPWGPYPYGYPYPAYRVDPGAAMRIEVTPHDAEVYLDGYYAGIVDDFNGTFQRLRTRPGEHEIVLYLDGYRTVHQKLMLTRDHTIKVKYTMEKLGANEQPEARPQAPAAPVQSGPPMPMPMPMPQQMPRRGRGNPQGPPPPPQPGAPGEPGTPGGIVRPGDASAYGTLTIRVQPGDAEVLIDREPWRGPEGQDRLVVDVAEGPHTVEIRKSGYRTYVTEVQIRRGETTPLNVSLRAQEDQ